MDFAHALTADGPAEDQPELDLFGRFIGTWNVRNRMRANPESEWVATKRTWIFAWVLGRRAVQDVLIGSDRDESPEAGGTTIRAFDPSIDAWRIHWVGPRHGNFVSLTARAQGSDEIRQDGIEYVGEREIPVQWNFSAITPRSFSWDGWSSADGGQTWWHEQHMDAERVLPEIDLDRFRADVDAAIDAELEDPYAR